MARVQPVLDISKMGKCCQISGIHTVQSCRGECRGASECRGALHLRHLCGTSSAVLSRVPVASRIGCLHAPQFTMATHPTGSSAGGRTTW